MKKNALLKFPSVLLFCAAISLLQACDGSEEAAEELPTVFTLNVNSDYIIYAHNWVIVHDSEGVLLGYKSFQAGQSVEIHPTQQLATDKIAVTLLTHHVQNGTDNVYRLTSYLAIDGGSEWTLSNGQEPTGRAVTGIGLFKCSISHSDQMVFPPRLTDKYGNESFFSGTALSSTSNAVIYDNSADFLLSVMDDETGVMRCKFLDNVTKNSVVDLTFDELDEFDQPVTFDFPPTDNILFLVRGREATQNYSDQGYICNYLTFDFKTRSSLIGGYLNRLTKYETMLALTYPSGTFGYINQGGIPSGIDFPFDAEFTLTNNSIDEFSYTKNQPFEFRETIWQRQVPAEKNYASWTIFSPDETQKIGELPAELATLYPFIVKDNFTHHSSVFTTSGKTYTNIIDGLFKGNPLQTFETYTVRGKNP